jgi:hypothetical protein
MYLVLNQLLQYPVCLCAVADLALRGQIREAGVGKSPAVGQPWKEKSLKGPAEASSSAEAALADRYHLTNILQLKFLHIVHVIEVLLCSMK